jgi:hypothetical protein
MAVRHALELITKTGIDQRMGLALEIADSRMITAAVAVQEEIGTSMTVMTLMHSRGFLLPRNV